MTPPTATAADTQAPTTDRTANRTVPDRASDLPDLGTLGGDTQSLKERIILGVFIAVPFLALLAAIPFAWGGFLGWRDVVLAVVM